MRSIKDENWQKTTIKLNVTCRQFKRGVFVNPVTKGSSRAQLAQLAQLFSEEECPYGEHCRTGTINLWKLEISQRLAPCILFDHSHSRHRTQHPPGLTSRETLHTILKKYRFRFKAGLRFTSLNLQQEALRETKKAIKNTSADPSDMHSLSGSSSIPAPKSHLSTGSE